NVFVAGQPADLDIARRYAQVQVEIFRDLNFNFEVVARAAADVEFTLLAGGLQTHSYIPYLFTLAPVMHSNLVIFASDHPQRGRPHVHFQQSAGRKVGLEAVTSNLGDFVVGIRDSAGRGNK